MRLNILIYNYLTQFVMALKYKVVSTFSPGQGKDGKQLWFPKITGSSQIILREIAYILHKLSTASESDVPDCERAC